MTSLEVLLQSIKNGQIVEQIVVPGDDVSTILNERDGADFSSKWMQAFHVIESQKVATHLSKASEEFSMQLRETIYLKAFHRWKSSDLAACISDDFGLIGDALALNLNDPWVNGLLDAYLSRHVPSGTVSAAVGTLVDQISQLPK